MKLVRTAPAEINTLLVLGHAPGIPDLVEYVCVRTQSKDWKQLDNKFPTSGFALVDVPGAWKELGKARAELDSFVVARG
jgi:phosphohistidine phosphatase